MFCYKCGIELPDGTAFCHKCGAKMSAMNVNKEISDSPDMLQKQKKGVSKGVLRQDGAVTNEQNSESVKDIQNNRDDFREFVNGYIRKNTAFQSAEELLRGQVSSRFVQICYGVPAVFMVYFLISLSRDAGFAKNIIMNILAFMFITFIFGYLAVHVAGGIMKNLYAAKFSGEIESHIEVDDLIQFLSEKLVYLSPHFHEWGYLRQTMNLTVNGVSVTEMDITGNTEIALCTEYGENKAFYSVIYIRPDLSAPDSGRKKYICNVKMRKADIRCEKYACVVKTAPILQAAMEYYLKQYKAKE